MSATEVGPRGKGQDVHNIIFFVQFF